MSQLNIDEVEKRTLAGLKDFQRATVERVDDLFRHGQNRVLVADEVGMGKTLIARGVIAKTARLRMEEKDDLFKVVYICSNQNIANQNIRKLDVTGKNAMHSVSDTRFIHAAFEDNGAGVHISCKGRIYPVDSTDTGDLLSHDRRRRQCPGKSVDVCHFEKNARF